MQSFVHNNVIVFGLINTKTPDNSYAFFIVFFVSIEQLSLT